MSRVALTSEVEALLREVATKPGSRLLGVPRPAGFQAFLEAGSGVQVGESFLSRVERHLIDAHRDTVSALLLDACAFVAAHDSVHGSFLNRNRTETETFDLPGRDELVARVGQRTERDPGDSQHGEGLALLARWVGQGARPDLSTLALASYRLVPSDAARIFCQIHLTNSGCLDGGRRILNVVLGCKVKAGMRSAALTGLGRTHFLRGEFDLAAERYRQSVESENGNLANVPYWFMNACWAGDARSATEASTVLDERCELGGRVLDQAIGNTHAGASGRPTLSADFSRTMLDRLGSASKSVLDAMC